VAVTTEGAMARRASTAAGDRLDQALMEEAPTAAAVTMEVVTSAVVTTAAASTLTFRKPDTRKGDFDIWRCLR